MPEVPIVPPMKSAEIENKADFFVRKLYPQAWKGETPVPVDHFFDVFIPESLHIQTIYTNLETYGVVNAEGYTNALKKVSLVDQTIADDFSSCGRRRFRSTAGHEAGHCVLHVPLNKWQQSLQIAGIGMKRERSTLKAYEDPEWQAWKFCQAFCMPRHLVKNAAARFGTTCQGIVDIANYFDVNEAFVRTRLRALKIFHS